MAGYKDAISIKSLDERRIKDIEEFVRNDMEHRLIKNGVKESDYIHFYSDFVDCKDKFRFSPGDKDTMVNVAEYARSIVDPAKGKTMGGIGYFKKHIKNQFDWYIDSLDSQRKNSQRKSHAEPKSRKDIYEKKLVDKTIKIMKDFNCSAAELNELKKSIVVDFDETEQARGSIKCLFCEKENVDKKLRVHLIIESETCYYWTISNFTTHVAAVHGIKTKRNAKNAKKRHF